MRDLREILLDEWILHGRRLRVKKVIKVHVVTDAEHHEVLEELRSLVRKDLF